MKKLGIWMVAILMVATMVYAASDSQDPGSCSGSWSSCTNAVSDGGGTASGDRNEVGEWNNYGFALSGSDTVETVTLRADYYSTATNMYANVRVSNDGGATWGSTHQIGGNTAEQTYLLDVTNDFSWDATGVNNIAVEVTCVRVGGGKPMTCELDYLPVTVGYSSDSQPTATAGATPQSGQEPLEVTFTGSVSSGDAPFTYLWMFGDGSNATTQNASHMYTSDGVYNATFTVTDADGDMDSDSVTITVTADTQPVVTASANPTSGQEDLEVDFSSSVVGGETPLTYLWNFGDGGFSNESNPTHTYTQPGVYEANVTVIDADSDVDTDFVTITVTEDTQPIATAEATPQSGESPLNVSFTGSATGGDGAITYFWDFGDGTNSSLQNPSHVYTTGVYLATLTVTDSDSDSDDDSLVINVTAPSQPDLTVSDLFVYEFSVGNATWVNATATVENIGTATAGSSTTGLFAISVLEQSTPSLAASGLAYVTYVYECTNAHNVSAFADWGFDITESNEANQASTEQFVDCIV